MSPRTEKGGRIFIGIDLGGTHVRCGAFSPQGQLLASHQASIEARRGPEAGLVRITALIEAAWRDAGGGELAGIGMGATGPVDSQAGTINNPFTLPTWEDVSIRAPLEAYFGAPFVLENDADAAALGEYWQGTGQGVRRLYAVTVGTGIGTALVLDGEVYRGVGGAHPEGGHLPVDPAGPACYCGLCGCWESLASGPAIGARARGAVAGQTGAALLARAGGDPERIDASLVARAALDGDPLAGEVMAAVAEDFSRGLAGVVMLFLPDRIVLSGGVMQSAALFWPAIERQMRALEVMIPAGQVQVELAGLGQQAGLYGAAYAAIRRSEPS